MTEETEQQNEAGGTVWPSDDPRFDVKWQKKESAPAATPAIEGADPEPSSGDGETREKLDEAEARIKDLQEKWHRAQADLANLRRRTEQERGEMEKFASMMLVSELLPVLDNFERALDTIPGNLQMLTWIQGVMLIERHAQAILERQGLTPIEAEGQPFNPHYHEAISETPQDGVAPGTVVRVYQKGYSMHGRVIRPALVEIAAESATPAEPPSAADSTPDEAGEPAPDSATENTGP